MPWTHCQCEPVKAKQSRSMAWVCCGRLTERRGIIWHGRWIMTSAPEKKKIGICNSMPSTTGMHMVMTTQCAVKDSWSGRQVWRCPSTLMTKLMQWQSLAAKQDTGKSRGHQTRRCNETWCCPILTTYRICIVGVMLVYTHSLYPIKWQFQRRPPLPRQCQSRIKLNHQVSGACSHDDKECGPGNLPQYCAEHRSKVSWGLTWILMLPCHRPCHYGRKHSSLNVAIC
jgi:hypothetical protein